MFVKVDTNIIAGPYIARGFEGFVQTSHKTEIIRMHRSLGISYACNCARATLYPCQGRVPWHKRGPNLFPTAKMKSTEVLNPRRTTLQWLWLHNSYNKSPKL